MRALLAQAPSEVLVLRDGLGDQVIDVAALRVGDEFVVRPGMKIATDGVVVGGHSAVDASSITGESVPVEVGPGDAVVGGCVNTHGRLVVEATRVGADTQLAQIARLVEAAQSGKAEVQRLADRVSAVFVPVVIALAVATLGFWLGQGADTSFAVTAAVAVLIIACPCALGLATPTALLVGTGRGAQLGIVIKGPEVLESARGVDVVVLDKTGTVTEGRMSVVVGGGRVRGRRGRAGPAGRGGRVRLRAPDRPGRRGVRAGPGTAARGGRAAQPPGLRRCVADDRRWSVVVGGGAAGGRGAGGGR